VNDYYVTAYHENISCHETNNKQHIGVNDISTVSLTFLTNVAPYHEKHILAYDEEQAAYRCQAVTFERNVIYHGLIPVFFINVQLNAI
jgi:hypothetical protein